MSKKTIIAIGLDYIKNALIEAVKNIEFVDILFLEKNKTSKAEMKDTFKFINDNADALMLGNITTDDEITAFFQSLKQHFKYEVNDFGIREELSSVEDNKVSSKIILKDGIRKIPVIPVGEETLEREFFNIDIESAGKINNYIAIGGVKNFNSVLNFIAYNYLELDEYEKEICKKSIEEPENIPFDGIFHNNTKEVFKSFEAYASWYLETFQQENALITEMKVNYHYNNGELRNKENDNSFLQLKETQTTQSENIKKHKWIGILTHRHGWTNGNIDVEKALIKEFEALGFKVIPVFSYASAENSDEIKDFSNIINEYFSFNGELIIEGLVNLQMLAAISNSKKGNIFEQAVETFKEMNIPIFRPLISHMQDKESWDKNTSGLSMEIPWSFTTPEMIGVIETIIVGCKGANGKTTPIYDRINRFVNRVAKWVELRNTSNKDKKITIFIHNAPCIGVEATIGLGAGLDVFESIIKILKNLKCNGYTVNDIPDSGKELHKLIMDKKAYHDFRWTSVEDIIAAGGVIYEMNVSKSKLLSEENTIKNLEGNNYKGSEVYNFEKLVDNLQWECGYLDFYETLDKDTRAEIEEYWGTPPGEGMVHDGKIIITGIKLGNITVMVQPKRGCYGAKCTGEVCKILHDPSCPPPHQYIATYKYIEKVQKANVVIHVGTGGSLEHLPGKSNALSIKCYPDIVLGNTPNIYIYNAGIGTEGTGAKRRSNAVIIDYLPSCISVDIENSKVVTLIGEYLEAETVDSKQKEIIKTTLQEKIKELQGAEEIVSSEDNFIQGVEKLKNYLVQSINDSKIQKLHTLGQVPNLKDSVAFIKEAIDSSSKNAALIKKLYEDEYKYNVDIMEVIYNVILGSEVNLENKVIEKSVLQGLKHEILEIYEKLFSVELESKNLIKALEGGFIEPGLSGMPSDDFKNVLPTGRNFYLMDAEKVPTKEAYEIGCKLANMLIEKYKEDEGKLPEKVAMNMISTDISMSKGEQLSQILYLMGVTPVWDKNGKVTGVDIIPLEKLNRPRIDVTVRISGVLRDSYPQAIKLIDSSVLLVSSLNESIEHNFIKKNTLEITKILQQLGQNEDIQRRSTIRVFGDKPGTYGAGVDLALKASAWKNEKDIAKIFTYFSSYAYGDKLDGDFAKHEFIENVKASDISYETTISKRYDILSSGFAAGVQGGFGIVKKLTSGKELNQYHGLAENKDNVKVKTLKEEIKRTLDNTFFNSLWKENLKNNGYKGAVDFMRGIGSIFDWKCLTKNIDDKDVDRLVNLYINDEAMRQWFNDHNKYALEEISRRFLELHERNRWDADKEVLDKLRRNYVNIEGNMEELLENSSGEIQGGEIEVLNVEDIEFWNNKLKGIEF